jgi:hypothetical protein
MRVPLPAVTRRRVGLPRVVEHAEGVAEPGSHVQVHHAGLAGGLGIVVGGADGDRLVERHDVPEARAIDQRIDDGALRRTGVAEQQLDAVGLQGVHEHVLAAHRASSCE